MLAVVLFLHRRHSRRTSSRGSGGARLLMRGRLLLLLVLRWRRWLLCFSDDLRCWAQIQLPAHLVAFVTSDPFVNTFLPHVAHAEPFPLFCMDLGIGEKVLYTL